MSLNGVSSYRFGEFNLDAAENVLRRGKKVLPLTPKMFELLRVLVENQGRLLTKEDLMKEVWADSFVEESNLAVTIGQLRKVLEDDPRHPIYIETHARRGYRFIANVEIAAPEESEIGVENRVRDPRSRRSRLKTLLPAIFAAIVLLAATVFLGFRYFQTSAAVAPILSSQFASEKLSTTGKVHYAVISPDGTNVVYTVHNELNASVWLRQLASGNNVEIIPPSDDSYGGLAFSHDGNFLYFSRRPRKLVERQFDIYRVSIFGGIPVKIASETQGNISVSADGERMSFRRCYYLADENCSLWVAHAADGRNELKLASRPRPIRIADNEISPDGKVVVFAVGQSENQANEFGLVEVDIESGTERELTKEKFFNIKSLAWLPDRTGLLVTASRIPNKNFRIWRVSAATGEVEALTRDSETYSGLSMDREARVLLSTEVKSDFRLNLYQLDSPSRNRVLTDAVRVSFAPNGKIVFSSTMSGNEEIWRIDADGGGQRQLTSDAADDSTPVTSPDGNLVYFSSNRSGEVHVWRMNADGSNQSQITHTNGGFPLFVSSDARWVYYHHGLDRTLWRVSINSGDEQLVLNKQKFCFALSPDGSHVAFEEMRGTERIVAIVSLADGQEVKSIRPAGGKTRLMIAWMPDGETLAYTASENESESNPLWLQSIDGSAPKQLVDLDDPAVSWFAAAPDGKSIAIVQGGWKHDAVLITGLK
jgi:Tol biopolymer transport system component/DNA-binding winged helix-turn-helix (wHTH) protein